MKYLIMLISLSLLVGCANPGMHTQFSCGKGKGVGCKSVSEVNKMVESGEIFNASEKKKSKRIKGSKLHYAKPHKDITGPERFPEQHISVWFAPYVDDQDNFHEQRRLYTVVKEGEWGY